MTFPPLTDLYGFESENDLSVFAVSAWHLGGIERDNAVAIRFAFLVPDSQGTWDTLDTPYFALTPDRTRELAEQLTQAADRLDKMRRGHTH